MKNKLLSTSDIVSGATRNQFLFKNIWKEKTTLLLHGERGSDKTSTALEIAKAVTDQGKKLVYVDTQSKLDEHINALSDVQGMLSLRPGYESQEDKRDFADNVISAIEEIVAETDIRVFIIDSLNRIAALSFGRNASAAYVMKRLVALQVRCGISIAVISHDTTKAVDRALLALADSEIHLEEIEDLCTSGKECIETNDRTDNEAQSDGVTRALPQLKPRSQLSRRERRMMRRNKQKSSAKTLLPNIC